MFTQMMDCLVPLRCMGCFTRMNHPQASKSSNGNHPGRGLNICVQCARMLRQAPWLMGDVSHESMGVQESHPHGSSRAIDGEVPLWGLWNYQGLARTIINAIKEQTDTALLHYMVEQIMPSLCDWLHAAVCVHNKPVAFIPAPTRRSHHHTNIAWQLAQALSEQHRDYGRYCGGHFMYPVAGFSVQARDSAGLTKTERQANVQQHMYFTASPAVIAHQLANHIVVVVDDVVTSGATMQAITRGLQVCGVQVNAALALCYRS